MALPQDYIYQGAYELDDETHVVIGTWKTLKEAVSALTDSSVVDDLQDRCYNDDDDGFELFVFKREYGFSEDSTTAATIAWEREEGSENSWISTLTYQAFRSESEKLDSPYILHGRNPPI